jgi:hypothetical protein
MNMGMMLRNAFERHSKKVDQASVTIEGRKRLDVRAERHERKLRNAKIEELSHDLSNAEIVERLGASVGVVKKVAANSRAEPERSR